ncbi:MAG: PH domain-containing protein [Methanolinea sp.]|jgi:membrane protein YdbS with pleckstrin-like domain|nr:PH domain-containing protein [Methanolinea sp.]
MAVSPGTLPRNIHHGPGGILVFSPSPRLRSFHLLLLILVTWLVLLPLLILVVFSAPVHLTLSAAFILLVIILAIRWYIPRYWESFRVCFTGNSMICERGVWRTVHTAVPYSRIRGLEIECGVVCHYLGISVLKILLDDQGTIRFPGVEEPEKTRAFVENIVRG